MAKGRPQGALCASARSSQGVLDGEADVAAIDGYAHGLLRRHDPVVAERLRVVATRR